MEARPPWLVRQENGTIAEARARAFLVDRFWVLERSADVEGADFIIQRRITHSSLLDRTPPRLGFIQVKFFASTRTTQYVHREYILDGDGNPRSEFFVMCHTGTEDAPKTYLLSAQEIQSQFTCTDDAHSNPRQYALPGTVILKNNYEISDRRQALDRIESALRNADFAKNRGFVAWALPSIAKEPPPLLSMYTEEIDNWWGDIPSAVRDIQKSARNISYDFEQALDDLRTICESQDPEKIVECGEALVGNWGHAVGSLKRLVNEDLVTAIRMHKKRHEQLTKAGLLNRHAGVRRKIKARFIEDVSRVMPASRNVVYVLDIGYRSDSWEDLTFEHRFDVPEGLWPGGTRDAFDKPTDMPDGMGTMNAKTGELTAYLAPGRFGYGQLKNGQSVEKDDSPWSERLESTSDHFAEMVMEKMLNERFGEWDET